MNKLHADSYIYIYWMKEQEQRKRETHNLYIIWSEKCSSDVFWKYWAACACACARVLCDRQSGSKVKPKCVTQLVFLHFSVCPYSESIAECANMFTANRKSLSFSISMHWSHWFRFAVSQWKNEHHKRENDLEKNGSDHHYLCVPSSRISSLFSMFFSLLIAAKRCISHMKWMCKWYVFYVSFRVPKKKKTWLEKFKRNQNDFFSLTNSLFLFNILTTYTEMLPMHVYYGAFNDLLAQRCICLPPI